MQALQRRRQPVLSRVPCSSSMLALRTPLSPESIHGQRYDQQHCVVFVQPFLSHSVETAGVTTLFCAFECVSYHRCATMAENTIQTAFDFQFLCRSCLGIFFRDLLTKVYSRRLGRLEGTNRSLQSSIEVSSGARWLARKST